MVRFIILLVFMAWAACRDIRDRIIPDWIPCGIAMINLIPPGKPCIAGMLACLPLLVAGITIGGIGSGDIKLTGACGLVLGFERASAGLFTALCLLVLYHEIGRCIKKIIGKQKVSEKEQAYPLVPFLFVGMLCSIGIGGII